MHADDPPEATVLTALDANPSLHLTELAARVSGDPRLVDQVCHDLEVDGCVRSRTAGRYSITVKGERRLRRLVTNR
jgi:predicted transcriptional regulator